MSSVYNFKVLRLEIKYHFVLLSIATMFWTFYFLGGLTSAYYQKWSFISTLIVVDILPFLILFPLAKMILKHLIKVNYFRNGILLAFYGSLPLFIYDYIYIVMYLNKDFHSLILDY